MRQNERTLLSDCLSIWQAGVQAVTPQRLMEDKLSRDGNQLVIDDTLEIDLFSFRRIIVVGGGKASAAMGLALIGRLRNLFPDRLPMLTGWINCPEGTFDQQQSDEVVLYAARPVGMNSPTQAAIEGTAKVLQLVEMAGKQDLVFSLISGGGSALLVAPQPGISLKDKQTLARLVAAAGGNIEQLNAVRRCISQVKGGGLARACRAGRLISLILSDVLGDPLEVIASGPTVVQSAPDRQLALDMLKQLELIGEADLQNVVQWLKSSPNVVENGLSDCQVDNLILGNLADAVDAAGTRAVELGYRYMMQVARAAEGDVGQVAMMAVGQIERLKTQVDCDCWISGGEPTVKLPKENLGLGGRNQQLALSVLQRLEQTDWFEKNSHCQLVFLSGGTDGEDGPTTAAGAWIDRQTIDRSRQLNLSPLDYLARADAFHFFQRVGGLLVTGPTGTNVCDLRICLTR